jgi:hypothetical protein
MDQHAFQHALRQGQNESTDDMKRMKPSIRVPTVFALALCVL